MEYNLIRSKRRTVVLEIRNGELQVKAPFLMPRFMIERFIAEKRSWIVKHLENSKKKIKDIKKYKIGEKYLYLGEIKTLEIVGFGCARVEENKILIFAKNEIETRTKLRKFFKSETTRFVKIFIAEYLENFNIVSPKVTYRFYKSKWGSCSVQNDFSFNALLSMAPESIIEYVVIHELCHCRQRNHSKRFWEEVERFDPNFKIHRKWLRDNHHRMNL